MRNLLLLVAAASALAFTPAIAAEKTEKKSDPKQNTYEMLKLFGDVFDRVRVDYVEETKDNELIEAALNGMLTSLDPHSSYMTEKQFKEMQVQTKGEFGGLGIEVTLDNGIVKVVSPIDDTPAYKAGVQAGDYVSHIDEEPVLGMTLSEAVDKMRGPVDTKVKLTLLREGTAEPLDVSITRAVIKIKAVKAKAEGDVAYIRINQFNETTTEAMRAELDKLKKDIPGLRGVVLDLRNNPGGLLDQAISVSDAFLKQGEIVSTRERDPDKTKRYSAKSGDEVIPMEMPIVVLINNGSASASEIVSGALQDHKRAVVLGIKSFGKGSVQTVIPLPEHGAIRLTTSRYYTPSGHSIQAKGITPDIEVQQAKIEPIKAEKVRLEADLRKRLQNLEDEKEKKAKAAEEKDKKSDKSSDKDKKSEEKSEKDEKAEKMRKLLNPNELDSTEDYQLQRALDLIHGISIVHASAAK